MNTQAQLPRRRLAVLAVVVVALFAALFTRLWYLQVLESDQFVEQADANRLRVVQVEAPRGRILDRNGRVLVDNRVTTVATVDRVAFEALDPVERTSMLARLRDELTRYGEPVTDGELLDRITDVRYSRYARVPVASDLESEELKIYIDEHHDQFPSVQVERVAVRRYGYGSRAAHVIGYVGEINDSELEERAGGPKAYIQGDQIGKSGVGADLRGRPSWRARYEGCSRSTRRAAPCGSCRDGNRSRATTCG